MAGKRYKVQRAFFERPGYFYTLFWNLTEEEAQAHCRGSETSSSTCTSAVGKRRTREKGDWFDCYTEDR